MPRIPIITPASDLDPEQKRVLEGLLGRRGGRIPGPYRFTLHAPAVTEYMHPFGELLRLRSGRTGGSVAPPALLMGGGAACGPGALAGGRLPNVS